MPLEKVQKMAQSAQVLVKGIPVEFVDGKNFVRATKTKAIKAKPINVLLADSSVLSKFLLDTIEGHASLKAGSMICIGAAGDAWMQSKEKLIAKYNITDIDGEGWITCVPKPDNEVFAVEIDHDFCVYAQYGEDHVVDGAKRHVLFGKAGDWMLQSTTDRNDVWIVAQKLFNATYEVLP